MQKHPTPHNSINKTYMDTKIKFFQMQIVVQILRKKNIYLWSHLRKPDHYLTPIVENNLIIQ